MSGRKNKHKREIQKSQHRQEEVNTEFIEEQSTVKFNIKCKSQKESHSLNSVKMEVKGYDENRTSHNNWWHPYFVFGSIRVPNSVRTPAKRTEVFRGFPRSLQRDAGLHNSFLPQLFQIIIQ